MICSFTLFGQTKSIKIYSNFLYLNSERYNRNALSEEKTPFEFEYFTLGYRKEKEESFWEYEAGLVLFQKDNISTSLNHVDAHFRIERGFKIRESSNGKFKFYISPSAKVYFLSEKTDSKVSTVFPMKEWIAGINGALFLRGEYHFSEKLYLDFNTTFIGGSLGINYQTIENPILTTNQRTQGGFDFDALGERLLRIGIGYKL